MVQVHQGAVPEAVQCLTSRPARVRLVESTLNAKSPAWESFVYAGTDNPTAPVFESDHLTRVDLATWTRRAYRRFYLRPSYVWQRLRRCTSWGEVKMNVKGFGMLLRSV